MYRKLEGYRIEACVLKWMKKRDTLCIGRESAWEVGR